jgi:hypothetical protein
LTVERDGKGEQLKFQSRSLHLSPIGSVIEMLSLPSIVFVWRTRYRFSVGAGEEAPEKKRKHRPLFGLTEGVIGVRMRNRKFGRDWRSRHVTTEPDPAIGIVVEGMKIKTANRATTTKFE